VQPFCLRSSQCRTPAEKCCVTRHDQRSEDYNLLANAAKAKEEQAAAEKTK